MPIVFWVVLYVESLTGSTKKRVASQHLDRSGTLHQLTLDYFVVPGEVHLAESKVYLVHGSCLFEVNSAPVVCSITIIYTNV
jgi:hypothetical protein